MIELYTHKLCVVSPPLSSTIAQLVKEGELDQLLGLLQDAPKVAGQPSPPDQVILQCPDNNSGWTALHYAAKDKSPLILEALLNYCGGRLIKMTL